MAASGRWATIRKAPWPRSVTPNLLDYAGARAAFSWNAARAALDGLPEGRGLNIAHEAVDRHAAGIHRARVAVRWLRRNGRIDEATYGELAAVSNRFANLLCTLGVGAGDRVFTLLGRVPELHVAVLGTLKNRSVACPLFSAFGPEPVRQRLDLGGGRVIVTTPSL
jgi:acetyl-CoA synthetase